MITVEALKHLEDRVVAASNPAIRDMAGIPFAFLPEGVRAESLEKLGHAPARFRGVYKTRRASDFVGYIKAHHSEEGPKPGIFIDQETMMARAILDLGLHANPGWGDHIAELAPKPTPAYAALLAHAVQAPGQGREFTQDAFLDFIVDWKDELQFMDGSRTEIEHAAVIKAVMKIHVTAQTKSESEVGNFNVQRSDMESVGISAGAGLQLPAGFRFSCQTYDELGIRDFVCVLRSRPANDKRSATLFYRIVALETQKSFVADEFLEFICDELREAELEELAGSARIGTFAKG